MLGWRRQLLSGLRLRRLLIAAFPGLLGSNPTLHWFLVPSLGFAVFWIRFMNPSGDRTSIDLLSEFDRCIRRDPAKRGLISSEAEADPLCSGHLAAAIDHLARFGERVWIVTGFFIPAADPPAAETDGPPGAAFLASALRSLGMDVQIVTDRRCHSAVCIAAETYGLPAGCVECCPESEAEFDVWMQRWFRQPAELSPTHVVAIERVGPSHRPGTWAEDGLREVFTAAVPEDHWDCCHNMRGQIIDGVTAPLHLVFERVAEAYPSARTIGIGDGGNEIGMGAVPWSELRHRLVGPQASLIPCRVATDWTVVAGVSNWGAVALAAGVCWRRGRLDILKPWDRAREEARLIDLVQRGPAVDGVTRLQEPTVDGLPFLTYLQPWESLRALLGLDEPDAELVPRCMPDASKNGLG